MVHVSELVSPQAHSQPVQSHFSFFKNIGELEIYGVAKGIKNIYTKTTKCFILTILTQKYGVAEG